MNHSYSNHCLQDLGKATFRGIQKCPKCRKINGLRARVCKNEDCGHIFQPSSQKRLKNETKSGLDCYRIKTDHSSSLIYSIRAREKGPNYRGFVEVPIIRGLAKSSDPSLDPEFIKETTARCHLESCKKVNHPIQSSIVTSHLSPTNAKSQTSSSSSTFETNITLTIIQACDHVKSAVKCNREAIPLSLDLSLIDLLSISEEIKEEIRLIVNSTSFNYLVHQLTKTSFVVKCKMNTKQPLGYLHCSFRELENSEKAQFVCTCPSFKVYQAHLKQKESNIIDSLSKYCPHFYLCLISFITNPLHFKQYLSIFQKAWPTELNSILSLSSNSEPLLKVGLFPHQEDNHMTQKLLSKSMINVNDIETNFNDWLSSVIEMINQSMHYSFNGKPDPLVFYCPHQFFDCLLLKIAQVLNVKRVPSLTTVFTRKDCPPIGIFTKYTYQLINLGHVQSIFSTCKVSLETIRYFIRRIDGTFDSINFDSSSKSNNSDLILKLKSGQGHFIKPCEFKTFLKVGYSNSDRKELIPFLIEWIPDLLPKSKVGEVQVRYQFGHLKNGELDLIN